VDIGFQERKANLAERIIDVFLADFSFATELFECEF
jgi:hypothetical protein